MPSETAVISAEPELRDFKKEATAFVPAALKRKKAGAGSAVLAGKVNAAPSLDPSTDAGEAAPMPERPDLMSTLRDQLGAAVVIPQSAANGKGPKEKKGDRVKPKDDYAKFMDEMGDILGTGASS